MDRESYLKLAAPISLEGLKTRISRAPDGVLPVYVIVYEDKYETALGDGEFLYAEWAYLDRDTAERACETFTEGCAHYSMSRADLTYDAERDTFGRTGDSGAWIGQYNANCFVGFLTGED